MQTRRCARLLQHYWTGTHRICTCNAFSTELKYILSLALLRVGTLLTLVLTEHSERLVDLAVKRLVILEKVQEFSDRELEDHTRQLAGKLGLRQCNLGVDRFAKHLLLLLR